MPAARFRRSVGSTGKDPPVILIVDDERDIRTSLKALLESEFEGVRVYTASTGYDALDILDGQEVHVVITDFQLPGMDGLKVLERVKKRAPGVRRGLITAYDPRSERHNVLSDLDFYLRKPVAVEPFVQAIRRSLTKR